MRRWVVFFLVLGGCQNSSQDIRPGQTTQAELEKKIGRPQRTYSGKGEDADVKVSVYEGGQAHYQIHEQKVEAISREPRIGEQHVNQWFERWQKQGLRWEVLHPKGTEHDQHLVQYRVDKTSVLVEVNQFTGRVTRVYEYAGEK